MSYVAAGYWTVGYALAVEIPPIVGVRVASGIVNRIDLAVGVNSMVTIGTQLANSAETALQPEPW